VKALFFATLIAGGFSGPSGAQGPVVPPAAQQIAAAVLPLPAPLREQATVVGYAPDMTLVVLRAGTNGLVCTGTRPGDPQFDVRCYQETFIPLVRRIAQLRALPEAESRHIIDAEVKSGKLPLPNGPVAGYRMLGPASAYTAATNSAGPAISSWQSIHFPYRTAAELGLPDEGTVSRKLPYVMASGTAWSHVMINDNDDYP
jgi:hypothetical protein